MVLLVVVDKALLQECVCYVYIAFLCEVFQWMMFPAFVVVAVVLGLLELVQLHILSWEVDSNVVRMLAQMGRRIVLWFKEKI